jgi:hypothetical protein
MSEFKELCEKTMLAEATMGSDKLFEMIMDEFAYDVPSLVLWLMKEWEMDDNISDSAENAAELRALIKRQNAAIKKFAKAYPFK